MKPGFKHGFTLIELIIILIILLVIVGGICFGVIGGVCMGNAWFTQEGVLKELQIQEQQNPPTNILTYKRNIYKKSVITTELQNGERQDFLLDSNVMFNYTFSKK